MSADKRTLSQRSLTALRAMRHATREKPVLPARYVFRRDAAEYLVRLGLALYRSYRRKEGHGGYWISYRGLVFLNESATVGEKK